MLLLTDEAEVAPGAEVGVEVVFRDAEDVRLVEQLVEKLEALALGEAGGVGLGRLEGALGGRPVLVEAARALRGVAGPADRVRDNLHVVSLCCRVCRLSSNSHSFAL